MQTDLQCQQISGEGPKQPKEYSGSVHVHKERAGVLLGAAAGPHIMLVAMIREAD